MERIVIAAYKAFPGKEQELKELMRTHVQILRGEDLVTNRKSIITQAENGAIVEVFGWRSKEAIKSAHSNPVVLKMWEEFSRVCEYIPINQVPESFNLFSEFAAMDERIC